MLTSKKISNAKIKLLGHKEEYDPEKVVGKEYLANPYCVASYCARRNSGKTVSLSTVVLRTTTKRTVFFIFSPTSKLDNNMMALIETLEKRGNTVNVFPSIFDGKEDALLTIVNGLEDDINGDGDDKDEPTLPPHLQKIKDIEEFIRGRGNHPERGSEITTKKHADKPNQKPPKRTGGRVSPDFCFILDDLAVELKNSKGVSKLCYEGRHFKASIHISFQYKNSLPPGMWSQISYLFLFKNFCEDKLKEVFDIISFPGISFEKFMEIYLFATAETAKDKYPFLLADCVKGEYRRNFNELIRYF